MHSVVPVSSSLLATTRDKSEAMEILGQETVRCKIFAVNKYLQKWRILDISVTNFL